MCLDLSAIVGTLSLEGMYEQLCPQLRERSVHSIFDWLYYAYRYIQDRRMVIYNVVNPDIPNITDM